MSGGMRPGSVRLAAACSVVVLLGPSAAPALTGVEWRRLAPAARASSVTGGVGCWQGLVAVQWSDCNKDPGSYVFAVLVSCLRDRHVSECQLGTLVALYGAD